MSVTRREEINLYEAVQKSFPEILIKDLSPNERICPVCNGLGMRIVDNVYGIHGDDSELGRKMRFPYKHQALSFCQSCFNGVQRLCPYCGKPYKNQGCLYCGCEGQKQADREEVIKKKEERLAKAVAIDEKDIDTMLYCEEWDEYYDSTDDFFEDYAANYSDQEEYEKPKVLWVCAVAKIHLDADTIVENACEDLHEEASLQCDVKGLQRLLNDWCNEQTGTTTYYPYYRQCVVIDWSKY